jgi:hypothetical protein
MSFTVEDFEDLLRLLYERPEWQERLRRAIMPPELFRLPALVEELAEINRVERERVARIEAEQQATRLELREGFAQNGERLDRVETVLETHRAETNERFNAINQRFNVVDERFNAVDERFNAVDARFNVVDERFDHVDDHLGRIDAHLGRSDQRLDTLEVRMRDLSSDMGDLKGRTLHAGYRQSPLLFDHLVPDPVALSPDEINALLRPAIADGRLQRGEAVRISRTDIIFRSASQEPTSYLAVEVSWLIDTSDVVRAVERGRLLSKLGRPVLAAVAGRRIQPGVMDLAARRNVAVIVDEEIDDRPRIDTDA